MDNNERKVMITFLGIIAIIALFLGRIEVVTGCTGIIGGVLIPKNEENKE